MKKRWIHVSILIVMVLSMISFLFYKPSTVQILKPVNGVLDLRNWSFEEDGIIPLEGTWDFYYKQFLTHDDFVKGVEDSPDRIQVPSTNRSLAAARPSADKQFYGTLRLLIKLPDTSVIYGLKSRTILAAYRMYIDGVFIGEIGKAGTDAESSVPYYNNLTAYISPDQQEIELIYHTSDFTTKNFAITAPRIGLASQIALEGQWGLAKDLFLFGMLLIMGIYHLGLFFIRTKDCAPAYFGVFCLLFALRMLLVGERFLPNLFPLDFYLYGRMAYLCVYLGYSALCGFLHHALDGLLGKVFFRMGAALGILSAVAAAWIPYGMMDSLLLIFAGLGFIQLLYIIARLFIGMIKAHPFAGSILLGFAALGISLVNDLIYQFTLVNKPSLIPIGLSIFTLTQAYTLSVRFMDAFAKVEQLSVENESILTEMKQMNTNLESLVQERTVELQKTLHEMEIMSETDYLTKLPNRRMVLSEIKQLIEANADFYIALADIDHFKEINDRFGHVKGDEILVRLSAILQNAVGGCGFVGRWGGEEFLIVLEKACAEDILEKANEIRMAVERYWHEDIGAKVTITIGICPFRAAATVVETIANADMALYQGKAIGRNQCIITGNN